MNSKQSWALKIDYRVYKVLSKIPKEYARKILNVIKSFSLNPFVGDIEKVKNQENSWRRRVGSYRIFYDIKMKEKIIEVTWVERRTSNTY
ncbi:MAG: type II toxin-antitoxin system RelE/ParE family toxin [Parcubacteria group bacterium]|nr:type II toxin-antitoxin system RelE/ParE family toxin [Parcubacteria group bacterium]